MKSRLAAFYAFLDRPLFPRARLLLLVLVVPLVLAFTQPLWRISMAAPQYPKGLTMDIHVHTITGGHDGRDLGEINTLNHYIGMRPIDRAALTDLDWIPFALGLLAILTLRCAAIGNVRALVDLVVLTGYIALFAMARFVYKLYVFGHELNPDAPVKVEPFTPAIFGTKQIANFRTSSYPQTASYLIAVFVLGLVAITAWHLWVGRREARAVAVA